MNRFMRLTSALVAAGAAALACASPASATVYTITSPTGGSRAIFENNGLNIIQACDEKKDGHSAVVQRSRSATGVTLASEHRASHGNGSCVSERYPYVSVHTQYMRACLADGGGPVYSCSGWKKITLS